MSNSLAPTAGAERAAQLDVLRGFALLGILLMNIEAMVGPLWASLTGLDPALQGADRWVDGLIYLLVQGKFYTLFSLLFGAGFALFIARAERHGQDAGWLFVRRMAALFGFGLIHALYIWSGDILLTYAVIGMALLLLFRFTPVSRLWKWGIALYLVPAVLSALISLLWVAAQLDPTAAAEFAKGLNESSAEFSQATTEQRISYGNEGTYAAANAQRWRDLGMMAEFLPFFGPMLLGMFLIGAWFLRSGALLNPELHLGLFRRLRGLGFAFGLPLVLFSFWLVPTVQPAQVDPRSTTAMMAMQWGSLLLCLAYMSSLLLAMQQPRWRELLLRLAPAGRMALSNYLLQSLICTGIFYGYGLGYFEQLPRAWQPLFVLLLFAGQVWLSNWWLQRYRFGPAEWLWRCLTYLRLQPMRREAVSTADS